MRSFFLLPLAIIMVSCGPKPAPKTNAPPSLSAFFDCVRENNGVLLSAHRGGPGAGYPENTLPTFRHTAAQGLSLLEIDVRRSADGRYFLLHDDTLQRTTTGTGKAEDHTWAQLQRLTLKDTNGKNTNAHIPLFTDVLAWARTAPVVLQLDIKGHTNVKEMVGLVRAAHMQERVMLITYTDKQAKRVAKQAPGYLLSVSISDPAQLGRIKTDIPLNRVIAWTGLGPRHPALYALLAKNGVETIYGALGAFDKQTRQDGAALYRDLVKDGVQIIATDRVEAARAALIADDRAQKTCSLPKV